MLDSMLKYKNDFTINFAWTMQKHLNKWKIFQQKSRRSLYSFGSILSYIGIGLLGFIPGKHERDYCLEFHIILAIIFFIGAVINNIRTTNKDYQKDIKQTLFPKLLKVFGENISYVNYGIIPDTSIMRSQLFNTMIERREDDDVFQGKYNDVEFVMNETDFGWIGKDKHRTYHRMFRGLILKFKLNKSIKSRVLIKQKRFFNFGMNNFEKVVLESDKFNKKFDVYANSLDPTISCQIEARYLLNTMFIERLMQIQTSFRVNKMDCSVYEDEMLIFLHTGRDLFEMNHLLGKVDDVTQYRHLFEEFASVFSFIDVLNLSSKTRL